LTNGKIILVHVFQNIKIKVKSSLLNEEPFEELGLQEEPYEKLKLQEEPFQELKDDIFQGWN
jgi:hypothetical protein